MPRAFVTLSDSETDMHLDKLGLALPTYLGQVACRTFIPDTQNPSITKQMNIRGDFFRDSVPYLQPGFGGFFTSATGETDSGADRSVQYAIEFPLGTITQAKVGASDTLVVPSGADKVFFDKMYPPPESSFLPPTNLTAYCWIGFTPATLLLMERWTQPMLAGHLAVTRSGPIAWSAPRRGPV